MMNKEIIAIIREVKATKGFKTDFYFYDEIAISNVTDTLYKMIQNFNKKTKEQGKPYSVIPYSQDKDGSLTYSFGCGTTHYLQQSRFKEIAEVSPELSFHCPLQEVNRGISVYLPNELDLAQEHYNYSFE